MKKLLIFAIVILSLNACVTVVHNIGPNGRDGQAFFGVDFSYFEPLYYWDNNPSIPNQPFYGEYYPTIPGRFDFEYGIDEDEYWYGYYEIWINRGGPGGHYGEPGLDGADNFLMLVCDPDGYEAYRTEYFKNMSAQDSIVIEKNDANARYKIVMKKGKR